MGNRNVVLFIATSLDGFIATKDGELDWLFRVEGEGDNGYTEFYETIDTMLLGRKSYEHVLRLTEGDYPHRDRVNYVWTSSKRKDEENVHFVNESVETVIRRLKKEPGKDLWLVGGSELIAECLKANLVDKIILTTAPILVGEGIPLFPTGFSLDSLELVDIKQFGQFVQTVYVNKG
ncbi:dihydrofolate reductase family protein [Paenisporosarcina cavernae]|uniref:Dihydrofolate reductase n=1 Tax=Paenisporosarcina cavernae TaxID=2320858 RepID=A0A385YS42_9BACL|nr:dihydrofolate reductase family protein [Paenisporosarcina cavernae]AYC28558.1 dihydrofolate reductase [Paenisporosarcina cavernae]